jgi:hypothetical protein
VQQVATRRLDHLLELGSATLMSRRQVEKKVPYQVPDLPVRQVNPNIQRSAATIALARARRVSVRQGCMKRDDVTMQVVNLTVIEELATHGASTGSLIS